jgi:hypothetical protein
MMIGQLQVIQHVRLLNGGHYHTCGMQCGIHVLRVCQLTDSSWSTSMCAFPLVATITPATRVWNVQHTKHKFAAGNPVSDGPWNQT